MMADQDMCSENEPTRYDEIRTRAENTTSMIWAGTYNRETGRHEFPNGIQITDDEDGADVTFYLNARQDIPWLLERIEALELEVACMDGSLAQGGRQLDAVRKLGDKYERQTTRHGDDDCAGCAAYTSVAHEIRRVLDGGGE